MTDIRGKLNEFIEMMELIQFKDDYLYILGNLVGSGNPESKSLDLFRFFMDQFVNQGKGCLLKGEQELFFQMYIESKITAKDWDKLHGHTTRVEVDHLSMLEKYEYLNILNKLDYFRTINTPYENTVLSHSGINTDYCVLNGKTDKIDVERTIQYAISENEYKYLISKGMNQVPGTVLRRLDKYIICGSRNRGARKALPSTVLKTDYYMDLCTSNLACYCVEKDKTYYVSKEAKL